MRKKRLLIGVTVCQKPAILQKFLASLQNLELSGFETAYRIIDDNQVPESKEMLKNLSLDNLILTEGYERESEYLTNETTHFWSNSLVERVANLKNEIIKHAVEEKYDYLFLIDSDLVIDPGLINHLARQKKDIISEVFWTSWQPDTMPLPNAWMYDKYDMAHPGLDDDTRNAQSAEFLDRLRVPGVYEVGGLGACTLLSVKALKKGLNFSPIKNVSFWGEDRWFCVRAAAMGFGLFLDTHYPAKHLYRESEL